MIHYFAYGSNLHPVRLGERVPSAKLVGATKISGYRLMFHKHSQDGSGKCDLFKTNLTSDYVHGAIYTLASEHLEILDKFEGRGFGYINQPIEVSLQGQNISCFTYLAQEPYIVESLEPYHWYKQLVLLGAHYLQFPDSYLASIEAISSQQDLDEIRRHEHHQLLQKIIEFPG